MNKMDSYVYFKKRVRIMTKDSSENSRPISVSALNSLEIEKMFDSISYDKVI